MLVNPAMARRVSSAVRSFKRDILTRLALSSVNVLEDLHIAPVASSPVGRKAA